MPLRCLSTILLLGLTVPLAAERVQAPDAPWRTFRTAHYRIHFPARGGFEPFAREVASKIEGIHARVTEWVGYESPKPVEVLIKDPVQEANGMAVALLSHPFVVFWRTPPEPASGLAHLTTWAELLVTHELTHIHHLLRPQNQPNLGDRLLDLPVGPLARKVPRWVSEGYATLIEGRITGKGRPHSAYRAAVIRQWALEGKLPDYGRISAVEGFKGGEMAYLLGSAYLEWLEARMPRDPDLLKKFWKQLASKKRRDFDASFQATFGFAARDGYDRWRAEATRDALELERLAKAAGWLREGELFAKVEGDVTDLAVSPDGNRLLARVLSKDFRGLRVWDLGDPAAKPVRAKPGLRSDPQEVEDATPVIPNRRPAWELGRVGSAVPRHAAWDGAEVRYEVRLPDGEGVLRPLLGTWQPGGRSPALKVPGALPERGDNVQEWHGRWLILRDGQPVVGTLSAAWNPSWTADGKQLFYTQLSSSGVEIRRLNFAGPPRADAPPMDPGALTARTVLPPDDEPSSVPPAVVTPPSEPYAAWRESWVGTRFGAGFSPSGRASQLGYGGADLLGRLSWQLLAGIGDAAGPRGAAFGVAWRGWRWAPAFALFSSLERPSRQSWVTALDQDRQRRGAELSFTFEERGAWPVQLRPSLALEHLEWTGPDPRQGTRQVAGLAAELRRAWRPAEHWGLEGRAALQAQEGRTGAEGWSLWRGGLRLRFEPPFGFLPLALEAEAGRLGGDSRQDLFHLGGLDSSLVPSSLDAARILQPALPDHLQRGDRFQRRRASLGQRLRGYWEAAAVWDQGQPRPGWQRVAGMEFVLDDVLQGNLLAPLLGRTTFTAGVHRILQDPPAGPPLKDRTVATLSVVVRP